MLRALMLCASMAGGHLASIHSDADNARVHQLCTHACWNRLSAALEGASLGPLDVLMGVEVPPLAAACTTGLKLLTRSDATAVNYTRWCPGEPSGRLTDNADAAYMYPRGNTANTWVGAAVRCGPVEEKLCEKRPRGAGSHAMSDQACAAGAQGFVVGGLGGWDHDMDMAELNGAYNPDPGAKQRPGWSRPHLHERGKWTIQYNSNGHWYLDEGYSGRGYYCCYSDSPTPPLTGWRVLSLGTCLHGAACHVGGPSRPLALSPHDLSTPAQARRSPRPSHRK